MVVVSFAAVFGVVTQRSSRERDDPKNGCEGDWYVGGQEETKILVTASKLLSLRKIGSLQ